MKTEIEKIDSEIDVLRKKKRELTRRKDTNFDGKKLRAERIKAGFSTTDFVKELKKEQPTANKTSLWKWEIGVVPTTAYLFAISKILKKPAEYFFKK